MNESKSPLDCLESLLVWIRERPHMYCMLVGELDSVLHYLHMVWAKLAVREAEYLAALDAAGLNAMGAMGIISQKKCHRRVDRNHEVTKRVLEFWSHVDHILGIKVRVDAWWEIESRSDVTP